MPAKSMVTTRFQQTARARVSSDETRELMGEGTRVWALVARRRSGVRCREARRPHGTYSPVTTADVAVSCWKNRQRCQQLHCGAGGVGGVGVSTRQKCHVSVGEFPALSSYATSPLCNLAAKLLADRYGWNLCDKNTRRRASQQGARDISCSPVPPLAGSSLLGHVRPPLRCGRSHLELCLLSPVSLARNFQPLPRLSFSLALEAAAARPWYAQ